MSAVAALDALSLRLAQTDEDRRGAERLRYKVFVEELDGDGTMVDHGARLERDDFDAVADQLILVDPSMDPTGYEHVKGVYRLLRWDQMPEIGRYYTAAEYDLAPLLASERKFLELGRSCIAPEHRGGAALFQMWQGLADYLVRHDCEVMFGTASFHGTDLEALAHPLSHLHHAYLAPEELRARSTDYQAMDLLPPEQVDRPRAMREMPPLIKAYLRLGGQVGDGAYIDNDFNTVDVFLVMDAARLSEKHRALYTATRG